MCDYCAALDLFMTQKTTPPSSSPNGKALYAVFTVLILLFGIGGYFLGKSGNANNVEAAQPEADVSDIAEMREGGYQFINPLLECDHASSRSVKVVALETELRQYVQKVTAAGEAKIVSVYFRDLNNGPWLGINENENYSPASLLKVPILIGVLRKAEQTPGLLSKEIKFERPVDQFQQNITDEMIQPGKSYTVEDLLVRMIKNSDNEAKNLLFNLIGGDFFTKVNSDLGNYIPGMVTEDFMSVRNYSSFFRILYNATYLNKEMSEKALQILSKTDFKVGIVAGLPQGTTIAHKFGERGYADTNVKQLHDCGIVYLPNRPPYLLCVMTRGTDFDQQSRIIADVSAIVYKNLTQE